MWVIKEPEPRFWEIIILIMNIETIACDILRKTWYKKVKQVGSFNSWLGTSFNGLRDIFYFLLSKRVLANVKFARPT